MAVFLASEDEDLLKKLLEAKFSASYTDDAGETALHRAVKANKPECVLLLLNCDSCDPNAADGHQQTALHRAGEFGSQTCLEMLVNHERVNIDAEDAWSRTALHWTLQKCVFSPFQEAISSHLLTEQILTDLMFDSSSGQ
jgi:ankyrin repeat protein